MINRIYHHSLAAVFRNLKWRLTLSYTLVALAAVLMVAWWFFIVLTVYLRQSGPYQSLMEVIQNQIIPALWFILPSALLLILPAALLSAFFGFLSARWLDVRLSRLRLATTAWRKGNFSVTIEDTSEDEISQFGSDLNDMAADLELLLLTRQELAALQERSRLARDLHDSVKQHLTACSMQLGTARALLEKKPEEARTSLVQAGEEVHMAQKEISAIILELRPAALESRELAEALRSHLENWSKHNQIEVRLEIQGEIKLSPPIEQTLFRFFQEALSNVANHSRAGSVEVRLAMQNRQVSLVVQDNGCGFDPQAEYKGNGLHNMHERIVQAGGRFHLTSQVGHGTRVEAHLNRQ
jgi:two-component system, NarL family, sensor histidine kinase LiaS